MVPGEDGQPVPREIENAADEPRVLCIVQDTTNCKTINERITLNLPASTTVHQLLKDVAGKVGYVSGTFSLKRGNVGSTEDMTELDSSPDQSLLDAGFEAGKKNFLHITDRNGEQPQLTSDESGTADSSGLDDSTPEKFIGPLPRDGSVGCTSDYVSQNYSYSSLLNKSDTGYVGLVNQAMTCYLNSLLQTLYMTPEFRNALYKWEFEDPDEDPVTSIPYQLQRLFVLLQTSKKRAIETTDVTRSFGWDSSEAWQQHDVQELCRVMFDALEQKWKQTEQADLINQLYQGKLKDYVRCLECGYESWRIDTFLDIPLVIRPYGASTAFGSVEEALHAFIQPETLDGPNQYFCERCKKKCDARKGLRFLHFPYLLTLQLKRFDFDYTSMHRIKLNDRMTFPEELDMSPFIDVEDEKSPQTESCTDSGAENEGSCHSDQMSNDFCTDDALDEGICLESNSSVEKLNKSSEKSCLYELFSVMVHSGSAAGGHYYACIRSFSDDQWYSFNDQHVSRITQEDIKKTYGGSTGSRGYYSSAFASSTNAYMLMYRLKNTAKNAKFLEVSEFPEHIMRLMQREKEQEEEEKRQREIERNTCKLKLFCMHPIKQILMENKLEVHKDKTMKEAVEIAWKIVDLEGVVPLDCCRLVKYDEFHDYLERSYEDEEDRPMGLLLGGVKSSYMFDLLLETKRPDQVFQSYKPGEVMVKVYVVDLKGETIVAPVSVRAYLSQTIQEFKQLISKTIDLSWDPMRIVLERCYNDLRLLSVPSKTLKAEGFFRSNKVFVESSNSTDHQLPFPESHLWKLLDRHANTIRLYVSLPEHAPGPQALRSSCTKPCRNSESQAALCERGKADGKSVDAILEESTEKLKSLSLQQQEEGGNGDSSKSTEGSDFENIDSPLNEADSSGSADNRDLENRILPADSENNFQSEERSDSDINNDRSTSSVDSDILSSSHSSDTLCNADNAPIPLANGLDSHSITSSRRSKANEGKKETWDTAEEDSGTDSEYDESGKSREETQFVYFKAEMHSGEEGSGDGQKCLLVNVDKRITLSAFKQQLEPFVGVASSQFKVFRVYASNQEFESVRLNETLSSFSDDNKITIRLGRALKKGEYRVKVFQLLINDPEPCKFLLDAVFAKGMSVRQSKEELIPQLREQCVLDLSVDRFRLRKKTWKNPGTVFLDYHVYENEISISSNWEVFLEVLEEGEKMKSMSQLSLLTKRWRPSQLKLEPFQEIVLETNSVDELREKKSLEKSQEKTGRTHSSKKKCASCRDSLPDSWAKVLCRDCINSLVRERDAEQEDSLATSVKELASTFSSFKTLFERVQPPLVPTQVTARPDVQGPAPASPDPSEEAVDFAGPSQGQHSLMENVAFDSQAESGEEDQDSESKKSSRYKLSLDEVEELLGAIYTTLGIHTDIKPLSLHDQMYKGLGEHKGRVFPVHDLLIDTVKKEWQDPERKPFFSQSLKRRFPFAEDSTSVWNKNPKLDAAFSQVSKKTDLAFEDMGNLTDAMDKRMDSLLKKAWESIIGNLKPELAVTVVARNLEHWLSKIQEHIEADTDKDTILASFPTILKGVAYIADASAESVRMSARSAALANSARRALWLKTWSGDIASKSKLCGIPFTGDLLFGPDLESVLDRTADKKKSFPFKRKAPQKGRGFRPQRQTGVPKPETQKRIWTPRGRGRGAIFRPPDQPPKKQ